MTTTDAPPPPPPPPRYEPLPDPVVPTFTVHPPTEPTDQERTMTSPTQTRHDELTALLNEICDLLSERLPKPPPTKSDPEARVIRDDHGGIITRTDVDPDEDEALARELAKTWVGEDRYAGRTSALSEAFYDMARAARGHIEWEVSRERDSALARAEKAEARYELTGQALVAMKADVERLTRERDDYARLAAARNEERVCADKRAEYFTDRYEALRADCEERREDAYRHPDIMLRAHTSGVIEGILDRDDERGQQ